MVSKSILIIVAAKIILVQSLGHFHYDYLLSVLEKFERFSYIVHFDTHNAFLGNRVLSNLSRSKPTFIASYNASDMGYASLPRPAGIDFVHLVLLDDPKEFGKHLAFHGNVILYHTVVFVIQHRENFEQPFWELQYLKFAGKVIVMNMSSTEEISVYKKCYYCGVFATHLDPIEYIRSENPNSTLSKLTTHTLYPSSFMRLHGQHLKIAHNEFFPYLYCKGSYHNLSSCDALAGAEWEMLKVLSHKLNFTYTWVGGEYDVFAHLLNNTADAVIGGVNVNYKRLLLATFTKFVRYEDLSFLYVCRISMWHYLKLYFLPFHYIVWISIFVSLIIISLSIMFSVRNTNMGFMTSFVICLQLLVEQTNAKFTSRLLGRYYSPFILLTFLFITCIVLSTSYKSMLSSILTKPPHLEPQNGEELIANGYKIVMNPIKLKLITEFFSDRDEFLQHITHSEIPISGLCKLLQYIPEQDVAILDEKSILQYKSLHLCSHLVNSDKLRITIEPIRSGPHAWALAPATPFWKAIDTMIGYLQNGGFLIKWTKDSLLEISTRKQIEFSKNNMIESKASDIVRYGCCFLLYILGNIIAGVVFSIELFVYKYILVYDHEQ